MHLSRERNNDLSEKKFLICKNDTVTLILKRYLIWLIKIKISKCLWKQYKEIVASSRLWWRHGLINIDKKMIETVNQRTIITEIFYVITIRCETNTDYEKKKWSSNEYNITWCTMMIHVWYYNIRYANRSSSLHKFFIEKI